jgi:hypothetical protein
MNVALRAREPWEAVDLGAAMIRAWWKPVYMAWFAVTLPLALGLQLLLTAWPWTFLLALWWLKPLYDRVVLHVLSQAVFGARPTVRETLGQLGALIRGSGLFGALAWRRFDIARAFNLPVRQLEGQRGADASARARLLGRRASGQATGLLYACLGFELIVFLSLNVCIDLLTPAGMDAGYAPQSFFRRLLGADAAWSALLLSHAFAYAAITIVEPLYVASGFALYLNRRTGLEAWDLELAFRSMQRASVHTPRALPALIAAALLAAALVPPSHTAEAAEPDARTIIREVLAAPEFREYENRNVWRPRQQTREQPRSSPSALAELFAKIAQALAELSRVAAYLVIAALVFVLVRYLLRLDWKRGGPRTENPRRAAPETVFGLDVRPEALPADLARLAAQAALQDPRMALSLLYRGALATLIHRDRLPIEDGDTEGDCLHRVRGRSSAELADYFARLVDAWSQTAYAGRTPDGASVQQLCSDWPRFFAPARASAA